MRLALEAGACPDELGETSVEAAFALAVSGLPAELGVLVEEELS